MSFTPKNTSRLSHYYCFYMALFFIGISFINTSTSLAQEGASISGNNSVLRENALNSREYLNDQAEKNLKDQQKETKENKYKNMAAEGTGNTSIDIQKNIQKSNDKVNELTVQEQQLAAQFNHEGLARREYQEACKQLDEKGATCQGQADNQFMGMSSDQVKALAKAYTVVIGSMSIGGGGDLKVKSKDPAKKDGSMHDYCKYISIATEGISSFNQGSKQKDIESREVSSGDEQKERLYQVAESYEERSKNSKISAMGFTGTAACYGAMVAAAGVQMDVKIGVKIGASALLGLFYWKESKQHSSNAEKLREIAKGLPGAGDCNPITEKSCYCAQPETMYDPAYCLPTQVAQTLKTGVRKLQAGQIPVACTDQNLKLDPECQCQRQGTCLDLAEKITSSFNLTAPGYAFNGNKAVSPSLGKLFNGNLASGSGLQGSSLGPGAARAYLKKTNDILPNSSPQLASSKQEYKALAELGVPSKLAGLLSNLPASAQSNQVASRLKASMGRNLSFSPKENLGKTSKSVSYSRGSRNRSKNRRPNSNSALDYLNKLKNKGKNGQGSSHLLNFAEKAQAQAEISRMPDQIIFDIISQRYQKSAWRRLELE